MEKNSLLEKRGQIKGSLLMLAATFLWGTSFVATKGVSDAVPACFLIGVRMLIGGIIIGLISRKKFRETDRKVVLRGMLLGVFYAAGLILQTIGINKTSAGRSAFLTAAYCILMPLLEWVFLKTKPSVAKPIAAGVCLSGIGLVALTDSFTVGVGDIYTLIATIFFALEIVLAGLFLRSSDVGLLNTYLLLSASVISLIVSFFIETIPTGLNSTTIVGILYLAAACTGVPLYLQTIAQRSISPTMVTLILGFEAVFAATLSAILFKEQFTVRNLIGFALVLASVFIGAYESKETTT